MYILENIFPAQSNLTKNVTCMTSGQHNTQKIKKLKINFTEYKFIHFVYLIFY